MTFSRFQQIFRTSFMGHHHEILGNSLETSCGLLVEVGKCFGNIQEFPKRPSINLYGRLSRSLTNHQEISWGPLEIFQVAMGKSSRHLQEIPNTSLRNLQGVPQDALSKSLRGLQEFLRNLSGSPSDPQEFFKKSSGKFQEILRGPSPLGDLRNT